MLLLANAFIAGDSRLICVLPFLERALADFTATTESPDSPILFPTIAGIVCSESVLFDMALCTDAPAKFFIATFGEEGLKYVMMSVIYGFHV